MRRSPLKRNPRKAKPKAQDRGKRLIAKADALAREHCKRNGVCMAQGWSDQGRQPIQCFGRLEWAHLKSRGPKYYSIRHDPENCVCLCSAHHRHFHNEPDQFYRFIESIFPGRWDELNRRLIERSKSKCPPRLVDVYQQWIEWYRSQAGE